MDDKEDESDQKAKKFATKQLGCACCKALTPFAVSIDDLFEG